MHRMCAACALHAARGQVREGSLLALFPMVHLGQGCVALSCSADGVRWARPTPLLACDTDIPPVHTTMQPAIGVLRRGELVDFYVHRDVAEVATTEELHPFQQATLVRYSLSAHTLADWVRKYIRRLTPLQRETCSVRDHSGPCSIARRHAQRRGPALPPLPHDRTGATVQPTRRAADETRGARWGAWPGHALDAGACPRDWLEAS